jgi:RNA polymerase sigma-70 factor (ECF subfamily)
MNEPADERSGDLLARWRNGDQQAADALFRRYADRLIALARSRLSAQLSHRVDPEDVVQSAYRSFFADVREGRYQVERGGDLWHLLVAITLGKVQHQVERHTSQKRAVNREQQLGSDDSQLAFERVFAAREPSPVAALVLADQVEQLMRPLERSQRRMLELRLQGHNLVEIAAACHCSEATVRRLLDRIKEQLKLWQVDNADS